MQFSNLLSSQSPIYLPLSSSPDEALEEIKQFRCSFQESNPAEWDQLISSEIENLWQATLAFLEVNTEEEFEVCSLYFCQLENNFLFELNELKINHKNLILTCREIKSFISDYKFEDCITKIKTKVQEQLIRFTRELLKIIITSEGTFENVNDYIVSLTDWYKRLNRFKDNLSAEMDLIIFDTADKLLTAYYLMKLNRIELKQGNSFFNNWLKYVLRMEMNPNCQVNFKLGDVIDLHSNPLPGLKLWIILMSQLDKRNSNHFTMLEVCYLWLKERFGNISFQLQIIAEFQPKDAPLCTHTIQCEYNLISFLLSICEFGFLKFDSPVLVAQSLVQAYPMSVKVQNAENSFSIERNWHFFPMSSMIQPTIESLGVFSNFCLSLHATALIGFGHIINYIFRGDIQNKPEKKLNIYYKFAFYEILKNNFSQAIDNIGINELENLTLPKVFHLKQAFVEIEDLFEEKDNLDVIKQNDSEITDNLLFHNVIPDLYSYDIFNYNFDSPLYLFTGYHKTSCFKEIINFLHSIKNDLSACSNNFIFNRNLSKLIGKKSSRIYLEDKSISFYLDGNFRREFSLSEYLQSNLYQSEAKLSLFCENKMILFFIQAFCRNRFDLIYILMDHLFANIDLNSDIIEKVRECPSGRRA